MANVLRPMKLGRILAVVVFVAGFVTLAGLYTWLLSHLFRFVKKRVPGLNNGVDVV